MPRARNRAAVALERLSQTVSQQTGTSKAFLIALGVVLVWALLGPVFDFSDTWQLVINTGTTIVTFLMVFLIQRSQNKEARALELKLDEIVAALEGASNRLIDVEDLSEPELEVLRKHYQELACLAKKEASLTESHSIEEAASRHAGKTRKTGAASGKAASASGRSASSLSRAASARRRS
jgi:low affinity Fe/Cu permease